MIRLLVVEDDSKLNQSICVYLRAQGYEVTGCLTANDGYDAMCNNLYDVIISDIMMPKVDGFEFAQTVRKLNEWIPILFMTARDDLSAKQRGYRIGIDDYLVKPFDLDELVMRIGALLRRAKIESSKEITAGDLVLNEEARSATLAGEEISLTLREFNILYKLLSYPKRTFSRAQLMDEFWGMDSTASLRSVDVYITKLREKLTDCAGVKIVTIRGIGYKAVLQ